MIGMTLSLLLLLAGADAPAKPDRPSQARPPAPAKSAVAKSAGSTTKGVLPIQKSWRRGWQPLIGPTPQFLQGPAAPQAAPPAFGAKLDLNHAMLEQIQRLPGVGVVWAPKLLAGRPYYTLGDIARDGIPFNVIDQISPLITLEP